MEDTPVKLFEVMGFADSIRADEGDGWEIGSIESMADRVTFHALEETEIELGEKGVYGFHVVVHGGPADFNPTTTGDKVTLRDYAVFFRSKIGDESVVGCRSLVQQSNFPAGTVIPDRKVVIEGKEFGDVEWGECPPSTPNKGEDGPDLRKPEASS